MWQELSVETEKSRCAVGQEELARQEVERMQSSVDGILNKLKEAREAEQKLEEKFHSELTAQTRLVALYKSNSEENTSKTDKLSKAVTDLQALLSQANTKSEQLEGEVAAADAKRNAEQEGNKETIAALKTELENANKLIKTFKEKGLSEASIENLSPSAAHASRLLKSGLTVTGIYSQLVAMGEELGKEKQETARLNLYIQQILQEVESRAPQLKKQREDYEMLVASVGGLTENLESAREEVELRRAEAGECKRQLGQLLKEKERAEQQVTDLGKQVSTLVQTRGGRSSRHQHAVDPSSADSVIEGRLLTFSDISELQQRNIELVAVVRELSAGQESAEQSKIEEKTAEVSLDF